MPIEPCNSCGACCRVGGECMLRGWSPFRRETKFEGDCDLLVGNECGVMLEAKRQGVWESTGLSKVVTGVCNFVELKTPKACED